MSSHRKGRDKIVGTDNSKYFKDTGIEKCFENTKEGIHSRAKELNMKPWTLGCSCDECNNMFNKMLDQAPSESRQDNVYATQIWNEAIEAAAVICISNMLADQIRKLKK